MKTHLCPAKPFSARKAPRLLLLAFLALLCAGPAATGAPPSLDDDDDIFAEAVDDHISDPLEGWNRVVYSFNDVVLDRVMRPLHHGYVAVTPDFVRTGVHNVFYNLLFPVRFTNNLLQGKGRAAGVEMSYFILNTTAGLGGLLDLSPYHAPIVPIDDEDMGQTFAVWGMGEGFYIVWPLLGPSTLKDSLGGVGDAFLDPLTYLDSGLGLALSVVRTFNDLDKLLDLYDEMRNLSVEPYSALRNGYIQYRRAKAAR